MSLASNKASEGLAQSYLWSSGKTQIVLLLGEERGNHQQIKIEHTDRVLDKGVVAADFICARSISIIHMKLIASELCCVWQDEARPFLPFPTEDGFPCNRFASNRVRNADKKSLLVQQMELATKCQDVKSIVNYARVVVSPVVALRAIEKQIHPFVNIR